MTIYDIAKEAGVSASTVSRVINGRPGIRKETRERVLALVRENKFSINEGARGLVNRSSGMIGILVSDIRNMHHIEGAYMISQQLIEKGYCSLLMNAGESDGSKAEYIRILSSRRVQAAVLIGSTFQNELVLKAIEECMPDIPIVMQNGFLDLDNVSSILSDEASGSREAVDYLYSQGRRHIVYINNNDTPSNRKKLAGYREAMSSHGLEEMLIPSCADSAEGGAEATLEALSLWPDTDSIIYAVDILAVGGSRMVLDKGLSIPKDISLIGTDNSIYSRINNPRLSTIDSHLMEQSNRCYSILTEVLEGGDRRCETITPALVLRETT